METLRICDMCIPTGISQSSHQSCLRLYQIEKNLYQIEKNLTRPLFCNLHIAFVFTCAADKNPT